MRKFCFGLFAAIIILSFTAAAHGTGTPGTLKWAYSTGARISSSPVIGADGTVYVGSNDSKLYALNPDGTLKWSYTTGNSIYSSPTIGVDGTVYIASGYQLFAINPNGALKRAYAVGALTSSSPAIGVDGTIYIGGYYGELFAIDPTHGLKWAFTTGGSIESSPAVAEDGTIYAGSTDSKLYAINHDGTLKWSLTVARRVIRSSPAIGTDGTIYIGLNYGQLYSINPDGTIAWFIAVGGGVFSSPAIGADGTIYIGSWEGKLCAVNPDGTLRWSLVLDSGASSPAVGSDGTIYIGSDNGKFHAVNFDGTLQWSYDNNDSIPLPYSDSSPVISADGTVYVGSHDSKLYAFHSASSGLAKSSWPMYLRDPVHTGSSAEPPAISVTKSGTGAGAVTSTPSRIDCGETCRASYYAGTAITLTATPDTASGFEGWSGGGCTGNDVCIITASADITVSATFTRSPCTHAITPSSRQFAFSGGSLTISVKRTGGPSATCGAPKILPSDSSWIEAELLHWNNGSGSIKINVKRHTTSSERTGSVAIADKLFTITQEGIPCTIRSLSPGLRSFPAAEGADYFEVKLSRDDCFWSVASDSPWIILSPQGGEGSGEIGYAVLENLTGKVRTGHVILTLDQNSTRKRLHTVIQRKK